MYSDEISEPGRSVLLLSFGLAVEICGVTEDNQLELNYSNLI